MQPSCNCALSLTCRYKPAIIQHCLQVYGCSTAQPDASQGSSSSSTYVLDARQVCLHYARKLLQQRAVWPLHEFLPAWQQAVPGGCWEPHEGMLAGEALVLHPEASEGGASLWNSHPCHLQLLDMQQGSGCRAGLGVLPARPHPQLHGRVSRKLTAITTSAVEVQQGV